jgi:DNA excision repair protein ERCC-2
MEKTLEEVRKLLDVRKAVLKEDKPFLAVGLSARRNLCIHPEAPRMKEKDKVDAECRRLTADWVYQRKETGDPVESCQYFDNFRGQEDQAVSTINEGVYSLGDLRRYGGENVQCPYYLARRLVMKANIVVYNYLYLLDPAVSSMLAKEHKRETVVVFDEAHNIDDVCIEAYTVRLNKPILMEASNNIEKVSRKLQDSREHLQQRLSDEYNKLLQGLSTETAP